MTVGRAGNQAKSTHPNILTFSGRQIQISVEHSLLWSNSLSSARKENLNSLSQLKGPIPIGGLHRTSICLHLHYRPKYFRRHPFKRLILTTRIVKTNRSVE